MLFMKLNRGKLHDDKTNLMLFQLAIICIHWLKVVQDKAYLSSGQLLNNHIYPVDRSCPLDRWFIQRITFPTVLNNRTQEHKHYITSHFKHANADNTLSDILYKYIIVPVDKTRNDIWYKHAIDYLKIKFNVTYILPFHKNNNGNSIF